MPRFMNMSANVTRNLKKSFSLKNRSNSKKRKDGSLGNLLDLGVAYHPGGYRMQGLRDRAISVLLPQLREEEKDFFRHVASGDLEQVIDFLQVYPDFNINCQDYQGYTALVLAIKSECEEMVEYFLSFDTLILGDALLHAVYHGNLRITEMLLDRERKNGSEMQLQSSVESAEFSEDITPLILASSREHYEIIQLLLQRGHTIQKPHPPNCFCAEKCREKKRGESLMESKARFNAYKALSSPAFIAQSSPDPILTAFQLSHELIMCADVEREFKKEYLELGETCSEFAVSLLNECRSSQEVSLVLHQRAGVEINDPKNIGDFARVSLAVELEQKKFVAHTNCQQVLRAAWLDGWQDWRRLGFWAKILRLVPRTVFLPVMALMYWIVPNSKLVKPWRTPINKFFNFVASYLMFLLLLYIQNDMEKENFLRGAPQSGLEPFIILYVLGLIWRSTKQLWKSGISRFWSQKWNLYDVLMFMAFLLAFMFWAWSEYDVWKNGNREMLRKRWSQMDPTLLAEAAYAVATIFAFGKLMYFFQIGNHMGPLQISISRMFKDITDFLMIFVVVVVSFATGLHKLYHYYKDMVRHDPNGTVRHQSDAFISFQSTIKTQFWALFGYSPPYFADVVVAEHVETFGNETVTFINKHKFTEGMGYFLFGLYNVAACIILVNLLIAMMSTSFMNVQNNADMEWKFTRTKVWLIFFDEGGTLPPPYNLVPSPKAVWSLVVWIIRRVRGGKNKAKCSATRCCYQDGSSEDEDDDQDENYQVLMGHLVQRYLSHQDQRHDKQWATSGDIEAIRHEIQDMRHTLRVLLEPDQEIPESLSS